MADIKWTPGNNIAGTAAQWTGIDYNKNGGIVPDFTDGVPRKTFKELLLDRRILEPTLLQFLQASRDTGYRQVFRSYEIPQHQGTLVTQFVGFKGGLSDPRDFQMSYGMYDDGAKNEQTFSAYTAECGVGYFGAFIKLQYHNVMTSPYDLVGEANQMLRRQAATVLDNVAAQALFRGGGQICLGGYNPNQAQGKTVQIIASLNANNVATEHNRLGPLSWDALDIAQEMFHNHIVKMPKIQPKAGGTAGETEIVEVDVNIPIPPQGDGAYTVLITRNGIQHLMNDKKVMNEFANSYSNRLSFFADNMAGFPTFRGYRFVQIQSPVTVEIKKESDVFNGGATNKAIYVLNFNGTGPLEFACMIGGLTTQESCIETTFLNGVQWSTIGFQPTAGDMFGHLMYTGWCAFYGATVLDTSKVVNLIYRPAAAAAKSRLDSGTPDALFDSFKVPDDKALPHD